MKNIISMVGTSLITNFISKNQDAVVANLFQKYRFRKASEYLQNETDINRLRKKLHEFSKSNNASAEIKSLEKISQELNEELRVYLLSSDTINSVICAMIIKEAFSERLEVHFSPKQDVISGLQVLDRNIFAHEGMENLFKRIETIAGGYYGNTIINITGGYKATIPLLTIFSQINNIPLYYIFENTEALVKIPKLPLSINWQLFKKYGNIFSEVETSNGCLNNWGMLESKIDYADRDVILSCFELAGDLADFSTAGRWLWNKYKSTATTLFINQEVGEEFKKDVTHKENIKKLLNEDLRNSKTENKNGHLVFDLGTTAPRIFYRIKDGSIYMYKYTRHNAEYERFLSKVAFKSLDDFEPFHSQHFIV